MKSSIIDMENKAEDARRRAALMKTWLEVRKKKKKKEANKQTKPHLHHSSFHFQSISESGDETISQDNEILEISRDIGVLTKEKDDLTQR